MDSGASPVTFNSLNDDVRHHILRYVAKDIPKKTSIYAHGTFEQIIQVYDERQKYKKTDEFYELEGASQYYDDVDYECICLAKSIVLHDRKDILAWALKKKDQYVLEAIYHVSSKRGKLDIIQEVFANADEKERKKFIIGYRHYGESILTDNAAKGGHFETLRWLLLNDFRWDSKHICGYVASSGNIEMLNWLLGFPQNFSLNEFACSQAAFEGQLEMLKLLREKGCPWDYHTCVNASSGGHLDVLRWSHENGCEINERCSELAARGGHLECLKYLHENKCPWNSDIALVASREGHLDILKYLYSNGCEWNSRIPIEVTWHGHYHILEWVHYRGFGFDKEFTVYLVSHNNLHILKCMYHCGYEMYEELPSVAARNKSLDTLRLNGMIMENILMMINKKQNKKQKTRK